MNNASNRRLRAKLKEVRPLVPVFPSWMRRLGYYGLALLFVAVAVVLRWTLPGVLGPTPFLAFYLAWVGAAAFGGLGPGLLATLASWLCVELLFDFTPGLSVFDDPTAPARLAIVLAGGLVVSVVGEKMRRGRIHERRQGRELAGANAVFRESEERLWQRAEEVETLMDLIPAAIWVAHDPQCNHITGNQAADRFYEAHRQENVSANVSPVRRFFRDGQELKPEELPMQVAAAQDIDIRDSEVDVLLPSGKWRNMLGSASPLHDAEGRVRGCIGAFMDITARKQAEEAVRQSERQFKSTFENVAIGIAHVALDGHILQFNSRFCEIAGYSCADVLGKTCEQITFADDWEAERAQIQRLLDGEVAHYSIEKRYLRADGSPVWVNLTRSIQRDEAGKAEYFIVLVEDISERKHAEEALRDLTAMLESKVAQRTTELKHRARQLQKLALDMSETEDRERQRLAEILHDDLQQVLAAAKFHVGLMRNRAKSDVSLQATAAQVDHMLKEAIDKSRSLSHELSPAVMHHGDFAETLRWLAGDMQTKHGFLVHVQAHGQTHPQSDAIKSFLYKTAQELLFNAIKHAGVNEARIRVRQCRRCVCLSVSDRGRGFDPQELPHAAGFGLLSIRERIELLGGRMKIKSAKGKGSSFFIALPQNETAEAGSEVEARSNGRAKGTGRAAGDDSGRLRVLLADDHEIVRQGLASLLSEEDTIEIVGEAANGREAVDLAQKLEPDVVVMDVAMPIMGGDEAARQIKQDLPQTRIISLSMFEDPELREKMYQAGAENYVLKTAPSRELLAAIRGKEPNLEEESRAIEIR